MEANVQRYVVVDLATSLVVNAVVWDGVDGWSPPQGCVAHPSDAGDVGDVWSGSGEGDA